MFSAVLTVWLFVSSVTAQSDTCIGSGYPMGHCCPMGNDCDSLDKSCSCDKICHDVGDCCSDIEELGCYSNTCTGSGHSIGHCCQGLLCSSDDESCSCSVDCYDHDTCCEDIQVLECYSNTCIGSGYQIGGCCMGQYCKSDDKSCSCDASCYDDGTCCSDISHLGCYSDTCKGSGHPADGCCEGDAMYCQSGDGGCMCDVACHESGDCCEDIHDIKCFADTCVASGHRQGGGCCDPADGKACTSDDRSCFCDSLCHFFGDCCGDIEELECHSPPPGLMLLRKKVLAF